jgi:membrane protease YdiL (CAAX protease family)
MYKLATFLILVFGLTWFFAGSLIISGETARANPVHVLGIMWSPGIAAILTCLFFQRNLRGLGWKLGKPRYLLLSYALPLFVGLVTYSAIWISGVGKFEVITPFGHTTSGVVGLDNPPLEVAFPIMLTVGLLLRMVFALGEEIGWRGLLVPHLAEMMPLRRAALLSGVIWAAYHLPGLLLLDYYSGGRFKSVVFFFIMAIGASVIMAWLRMTSGSLWTGATFHAGHNLAIQGIFDHFTVDTGNTTFFAGEFGLGLALAYSVAAVWFWKRMPDLQTAVRPTPSRATPSAHPA